MKKKQKPIDKEINKIYARMDKYEIGSVEWQQCLEYLKNINEIKMATESHKKVNINTVIQAGVAIAQIGIIVGHEKLNIITTKALGFVKKGS